MTSRSSPSGRRCTRPTRPTDPTATWPGGWATCWSRSAGTGTPGVQDFCLGEIALARGTGVMASRNALADVLDLQHRLPLTWAVCRRGRVRGVGRTPDREALTPPRRRRGHAGRLRGVADDRHRSRPDGSSRSPRPRSSRPTRPCTSSGARPNAVAATSVSAAPTSTACGLLIARLEAGDAAAVDAIVHRVAEIIAPRHPDAHPDELRALAFGWLARPAELLTLLLEHTEPSTDLDTQPTRPRRSTDLESTTSMPSAGHRRSPPTSSTRCAAST